MKITIPNFNQSPVAFMRSCGYAFDRETGPVKPAGHGAAAPVKPAGHGAGVEVSCMRRLSGHDYPRYHAYVHTEETTNNYSPRFRGEAGKLKTKNLIVNLHIDQKKPSYEGSNAHNGEYDGELVERELERIRGFTEA